MADMTGKSILIISMDAFEKSELFYPRSELKDAGATVHVASEEKGEIRSMDGLDWSDPVDVDKTFADVDIGDYDALVIPGGVANPDQMRTKETAVKIVRDFHAAGKPVAAICHAPWMLVEADILREKRATSYPTLRTDLKNAGATVVDEECVVDGNLITSRNPDDLPAFVKAIATAVTG